MQKDNYSLLIEKLDGFIRKFYINQLLRGALYTVGLVLGLFILFNVLEYYFYFGTGVRTAMLVSFLGATGFALYRWIGLPLLHYFRLGKVISHEQAASIIGDHFTDVKDKLLNILQLKQQSSNAIYADLINASINQKSEEIKFVPFKSAIDLRSNRKYLRYALPPLFLLLFLLLGAPNIIREGANRLFNSRTEFERPAPFKFIVNIDSLKAVQFSDFTLNVKVEGNALPNEMFIKIGSVQYRLNKDAANAFSYKFSNVQKDTEFNLFAGGVESRTYTLQVLRKPNILAFSAKLNYPDYTGRADEELDNIGELLLPQGTQISWVFNAQNTDVLGLQFSGENAVEAKRIDDEFFSFSRRAMKDELYKVFLSNALLNGADSVLYSITVIPDQAPSINVEEFKDSSNLKQYFFAGDASDDYGLMNLTFNYQIKKAKAGLQPVSTIKIDKPAGKQTQYEYAWNVSTLGLEPGDEVSYYFEIFDNDGVNGPKSARTGVMNYRMPSLDEYRDQQAANNEELKKDLEASLKESEKINEDLKKLREKILQKKEVDWQTRKELERLVNRQKQLQQQIEEAKMSFDQNKEQQKDFNQTSEELQQKQEELQKRFEEVMSDEMKQLLEDIQKLMQDMNKEQMLDEMEKMQEKAEERAKDMERLQELFKQLEVEQMLDEQISNLEEMAEKEDKLAEQSEKDPANNEEIKKEQEDLTKQFEKFEKKMDELLEKNKDLKRPQKIENNEEDARDAKKDMKDSQQELNQQNNKGASKKQKSASGKMKNMANKMKQNKQGGDMKAMEEDLQTLRQLLENLVGLSFNQEQVAKDVEVTTINTPRYVELGQQQFKLKDDFKLVEDSLQALASRQAQIEGIITDKVAEIKSAMKVSLEELVERRVTTALEHQQRSMKSLNDLANLLADAMQNMQQQMASGMPGSQSCQKPGSGSGEGKSKGPKDKMSKGQEDLNKIMKDLKERMEKQGKNPGQGKGSGGGEGSMSKEFAQMAAQQAALRNALREMQKEKQAQGKGSKALDELIKEMDKTETDLVNKRLTNEMMRRQQDILTRLLEEERADREREQDEKRQAETAQQQPAKMPPALEEYLRKRRAEVEQFRTVSPALKPYYKQLVEEYLKSAGGSK